MKLRFLIMEKEVVKVYVAVGKDMQEGVATLEWALRKWSLHSISIVIIHFSNCSKDFVNTPFGKFPASSLSDEKLEDFKMYEKEKTEKLLTKYLAYCGKVRAEIINIEIADEPIHKVIIEVVTTHQVKKLVMGITFTKSISLTRFSSWKSKSGISGSFYVHKHKPSFCELFIICGGKMVSLEDENDRENFEDGEEVMATNSRKKTREKSSLRGWIGRILPDSSNGNTLALKSNSSRPRQASSPTSVAPCEVDDKWENCAEEIETYFQSISNVEETEEWEDCALRHSPIEETGTEDRNSNMDIAVQKIETVTTKIENAKKMAEVKRSEAKANVARRTKADWVIRLCSTRAEELEAHLNEEITKKTELSKDLEKVREQLEEVSNEIREIKDRLKSAVELEEELKNVIHLNACKNQQAEAQFEKTITARADMVQEIDTIRRQRDVLRRRIQYCREREAISWSNNFSNSYREFTAEELKEATDDFSEENRVKTGVNGLLYIGRINRTMVAIKLQNPLSKLSQEEFQAKMAILSKIRHPHLVTVIGACKELKSVVYEYMHNGSLHDLLFSNPSKNSVHLPWRTRFGMAVQICSAVGFLHSTQPGPTTHGRLKPSNVLLDRNLVAKVADFGMDDGDSSDVGRDVRDLGLLMLQMGVGGEEGVGTRCVRGEVTEMGSLVREMEELRRSGGEEGEEEEEREEKEEVPAVFLCPILQEIMKDPHVATDGFSYEQEAIQAWLSSGHDTSPMTNLQLRSKILTPNHTLRALIQDWLRK